MEPNFQKELVNFVTRRLSIALVIFSRSVGKLSEIGATSHLLSFSASVFCLGVLVPLVLTSAGPAGRSRMKHF